MSVRIRKSRRRRLQRAYGWFRCKQCSRMWESSHVYRFIGTLKVRYRQACKKCRIFTGPFKTECFNCGEKICYNDCYPDEEFGYDDEYYDDADYYDDNVDDEEDDNEGRRHVDDRKPHESSLCEKCQSGRPCGQTRRRFITDDDDDGDDDLS